jgi:hypothetical protein
MGATLVRPRVVELPPNTEAQQAAIDLIERHGVWVDPSQVGTEGGGTAPGLDGTQVDRGTQQQAPSRNFPRKIR